MTGTGGGWRALVVAAAAALGAAGPLHAQCQYELVAGPGGSQVIQAPPCPFTGPPPTRGTGMNAQGWVCGWFDDCSVSGADWGYWWTPETGFHIMPKPQGVFYVRPSDINDAGFIVGTALISGTGDRGFIFDIKTQEYTYLPPGNADGHSWANAINNSNVVAGARSIGTSGVNPYNAVIWEPFAPGGEIVTDLGVMNGPNSSLSRLNRFTDAAGWYGTGIGALNTRAVLWNDLRAIELGIPPGAVQSQAWTVNAALLVGGSSRVSIPGPFVGFLWSNGAIVELTPQEPYDRFLPGDLNDVGQLVGNLIINGSPSILSPGIWQHGKFHDVVDLMVDPPQGLILSDGVRVNEDGHILCRATLNSRSVAVTLRPVTQPLTDLNHDCRTDTHDLLILLEQWGPVPSGGPDGGQPSADFNDDGRVDVLDLLILLSNWG